MWSNHLLNLLLNVGDATNDRVAPDLLPCCFSHQLDSSTILPPPPLVQSLLAGVLVYCGRGCGKLVRLDNHDRHSAGHCQGYYHQQVDSPSKMTLRDVLVKSAALPATPAWVKVAGYLVRWMLDSAPEKQIAKVPTCGQIHLIFESLTT